MVRSLVLACIIFIFKKTPEFIKKKNFITRQLRQAKIRMFRENPLKRNARRILFILHSKPV